MTDNNVPRIDDAARDQEAKRLMALALDFWSAPGIDMPDIDTFDAMVKFLGEEWAPRHDDGDDDGIKPVGLLSEQFEVREAFVKTLKDVEEPGISDLDRAHRLVTLINAVVTPAMPILRDIMTRNMTRDTGDGSFESVTWFYVKDLVDALSTFSALVIDKEGQ